MFPSLSNVLSRRTSTAGLGAAAVLGAATVAAAQPGTPVYQVRFRDCVTGDNRFVGQDGAFQWDVDRNCDVYQKDLYERPTSQTYVLANGRYGAFEYFENLDITAGKVGIDNRFLYVAIDLAGRNQITSDGSVIPLGMNERYGFRMSFDPDGRYGYLIVSDQPEFKNEPKTRFGPLGTFGYVDTNGDVGGADEDGPTGLTVTKSDNPQEEDGLNGYDTAIIADGTIDGETPILWVRLSPQDSTVVELALDYTALGLTRDEIRTIASFEIEAIKGGPKDPQNYRWNDKYTKQEAGSPNKGVAGLSEFGTQGCQNIYEVDTARAR